MGKKVSCLLAHREPRFSFFFVALCLYILFTDELITKPVSEPTGCATRWKEASNKEVEELLEADTSS